MKTVSTEKAMNRTFSKSAILFGVQILMICIVVIASIINISLYNKDREMWTALLHSSLGYVLPRLKTKFKKNNQRVFRLGDK